MNFEEKQRRQKIRVVFSEILMSIAVILMSIFLVLIVSGYYVNEDFEVERQGMISVSSTPEGANVSIDGVFEAWYVRTNMSKMISTGEHSVKLEKEGYDTWEKTVSVSEGLLYRLRYPHLFLKEKTAVLVEKESDIENFEKRVAKKAVEDAKRAAEVAAAKAEGVEITGYDAEGNLILDFYDNEYVVGFLDEVMTIMDRDKKEVVKTVELAGVPDRVSVGKYGDYVVMNFGSEMGSFDLETMEYRTWTIESEDYFWLNYGLIGVVLDGDLVVYDFDGLNRRIIASGVEKEKSIMFVDENLYYYSVDGLMKEKLY